MAEAVENDLTEVKPASDRSVRIAPLTIADLDSLVDLFSAMLADAPYGHLAERTLSDFRAVLEPAPDSASVGAWHDDRLVGYSLCSLDRGTGLFPRSPLLQEVQKRGFRIWTGKGTVILPRFQGQLLMSRLLRQRSAMIEERGSAHLAGMIATSNLPSLAATMRPGAWVVGFEHDAYCENFVCYRGDLCDEFEPLEERLVAVDDLATMADLFEQGWVGIAMRKSKDGGPRQVTMVRIALG